MPEPGEGQQSVEIGAFEKKAIDISKRITDLMIVGARGLTKEYYRGKQVKTSVKMPIERMLRGQLFVGKPVIPVLNQLISSLDTIESKWHKLQGLWRHIMNFYTGIGLKRSIDYTGPEITMCKFGSIVEGSDELKKRVKEEEESMDTEMEEGAYGDAEPEEEGSEEEEGEEPKSINGLRTNLEFPDYENEEERMNYQKIICPLDNPAYCEWYYIKIKIKNEKDEDEIIKDMYPLPAEVTLKTWHSLINDVNFALDTYPARYFGFEKNTNWRTAYDVVLDRMCKKLAKRLIEVDKVVGTDKIKSVKESSKDRLDELKGTQENEGFRRDKANQFQITYKEISEIESQLARMDADEDADDSERSTLESQLVAKKELLEKCEKEIGLIYKTRLELEMTKEEVESIEEGIKKIKERVGEIEKELGEPESGDEKKVELEKGLEARKKQLEELKRELVIKRLEVERLEKQVKILEDSKETMEKDSKENEGNGKYTEYEEYVNSSKALIKDSFEAFMGKDILKELTQFEKSLYPFLRRRTQQFAGRISQLEGDIDDLRPSKFADIYYERTYKIVNPDRVVRAKIYNNAQPLYKLLFRLMMYNLSEEDEIIKSRITTEDKSKEGAIKKYLKEGIADEIFELLDTGFDEQAEEGTGKHKPGPFGMFLKKKYGHDESYVESVWGGVEKNLQKKFEGVNEKIRTEELKKPKEDRGEYYLTWSMMGVSFEDRKGHIGGGDINDERAPGLDENNWPFEVEDIGDDPKDDARANILLDGWEKRAVRSVPGDFVTEMDLLLKTNVMNNEYDAVRDDLRDGRYHENSLTVFEYILAIMAKWGPESSRLIGDEFKNQFRYEGSLKENDAVYTMQRYNLDGVDGVPRDNAVPGGSFFGGINPLTYSRKPSNLNPAFQLSGIKKFRKRGKFFHLGRKRYYDTASAILGQLSEADRGDNTIKEAIGACVTTRGTSMYVIEKVLANVRGFDDAGKILDNSLETNRWYDYGPRGFNKPGPRNPLKLNLQRLNASLEPSTSLKIFDQVTSTEDKVKELTKEDFD